MEPGNQVRDFDWVGSWVSVSDPVFDPVLSSNMCIYTEWQHLYKLVNSGFTIILYYIEWPWFHLVISVIVSSLFQNTQRLGQIRSKAIGLGRVMVKNPEPVTYNLHLSFIHLFIHPSIHWHSFSVCRGPRAARRFAVWHSNWQGSSWIWDRRGRHSGKDPGTLISVFAIKLTVWKKSRLCHSCQGSGPISGFWNWSLCPFLGPWGKVLGPLAYLENYLGKFDNDNNILKKVRIVDT